MAQSVVLAGAMVKVYFGGTLLNECQSISYAIDYGEEPIFGIDSAFPQEIASGRVTIQGSCTIVYVQGNDGLQGKEITPRVNQILYTPYISLRVKDRKADSDLFFCPQVKITNESTTINAKGTVKVTFNFRGIIPYSSVDLK